MKKNGKIFNIIIVFIILLVIAMVLIIEYDEKKLLDSKQIENSKYVTKNLSSLYEVPKENKIIVKESIIEKYKDYDVIAKLEIPEIKLETYVLKEFSNTALDVSVVKFWGPEPNKIGNLCIAGHNFRNKNMFHNLKKLTIGDKLFISDNNVGRMEYEVYEFYRVSPEDVSCLSQETNAKREVTLITCTNDSKKRIIVKAKEI